LGREVASSAVAYHFTAHVPGWPVAVLVVVGESKPVMLRTLERFGCSLESCLKQWDWTPDHGTSGHTAVFPCNHALIWFKRDAITAQNLATVSHEVFHLVFGALNHCGMKLTDESEEAYAYAIGNLTTLIVTEFDRRDRLRAARAIIAADGKRSADLSKRRAAVRRRTATRRRS
jgi:hypothetical protein